MSNIEWTDATWNPTTGCTAIASGCANCYAVPMTHRLGEMGQEKYVDLTVLQGNGRRMFSGKVRCHEDVLPIPLKWRKPRRVFVNSMSDLFHEAVPFDFIDQVFAVMALCPQHTFQVLTKRPERMAEYLSRAYMPGAICDAAIKDLGKYLHGSEWKEHDGGSYLKMTPVPWPLPNVWLGTSASTQADLDRNVPHLLRCPAAVRFLSLEPLVEEVDLHKAKALWCDSITRMGVPAPPMCREVSWVIVGGESGPNARPCSVEWIRSVVGQCKAAGVPVFVKQLGSNLLGYDEQCWRCGRSDWGAIDGLSPGTPKNCNVCGADSYRCRDRKGGDMSEWPADLRVRQWPEQETKT